MKKVALIFCLIAMVGIVSALNLSEANVVDVEKDDDSFSVTMIHDDSGEDGYANWWQLENTDGEMLGRRELLHSHGTRNFTRSETIPTDEDKVVIRAHDQTHGYGGQAILFDTETGEKTKVKQGVQKQTIRIEEDYSRNKSSSVKKTNRTEKNKVQSSEKGNKQNQSERSLIEDILYFLTELF